MHIADEFAKGEAVDFQAAGNTGLRVSAFEQVENFVLASGEFHARVFTPKGTAEEDTLGALVPLGIAQK